MTDTNDKALVVLEQDDINTLIHTLEEEMDQLQNAPVDTSDLERIHKKLMVIIRDDGSDYRVK